jgi:prepilin-type N-terminal cleavage/methylation domain-containing protein
MKATYGRSEAGFSLIETMIAMGILAVGLLGVVGAFAVGNLHMAGSTPGLIAREKAREAVESVHTARDTRVITWDQIRSVDDDGVFLTGARPLNTPGEDGLVNTADDGAVERLRSPGADGTLNTADDDVVVLNNFTREIRITDINANLREIRVVVRYLVNDFWRSYTLTTYISSFS